MLIRKFQKCANVLSVIVGGATALEPVLDALTICAVLAVGCVPLSHSPQKERNAVSVSRRQDVEETSSVKEESCAHQIGSTNGQRPKNETNPDSMILFT